MENSAALELFQLIVASDLNYFENLEGDLTQESELLDFKLLENSSLPLTQSDKKNLSKGLGGFTNGNGGVLVWGVDCRTGSDNIDRVRGLKPIANLTRLISEFSILSAQLVSPGIRGVRQHPIFTDKTNDMGDLITYVPRGDDEPIMSTASGLHEYYYRIGSEFKPINHSMLSDQFLRRPKAHLKLVLLKRESYSKNHHANVIACSLGLLNVGRGVCSSPGLWIRGNHVLTLGVYSPAAPQPALHLCPIDDPGGFSHTGHFYAGNASHIIYAETICFVANGALTESDFLQQGDEILKGRKKQIVFDYQAYSDSGVQTGNLSILFQELLDAKNGTLFRSTQASS